MNSYAGNLTGSVKELRNVDYYKRYILINPINPERTHVKNVDCDVTIVNMSSSTGKGYIGRISESEKYQTTNMYHCRGKIFKSTDVFFKPNISENDISFDAMLTVRDTSYGKHHYELNTHVRSKGDALRMSNSYGDIVNRLYDNYNQLPNIRFYNQEHHIWNQDRAKFEYLSGNTYYDGEDSFEETVSLRELIDDKTTILFYKTSNFEITDGSFSYGDDEFIDGYIVEEFIPRLISPITDLGLFLMANSMEFVYDTERGFGNLKYNHFHKLPTNDHYKNQIINNAQVSFMRDIDLAKSDLEQEFLLFVKSDLGQLKIKVIVKDEFGNFKFTQNAELQLERFRNNQHNESMIGNFIY
jgi:hypothetical protein